MISFFLISLPIFGVIGVGWAATRTRLVAQGALDALNAFSFRFALPALLLRLIAGQPLRQSFNPEFYTGYLASGAIIFVLVLGTSRVVAARDLSTTAAHATTATVSNLGFLGPPLMLAFFGERGAGPLAMAILAEVMVLLSVGSVLMGANGGPKRGIGSLILRGTMFNPIVVAIVLGAALAGTGLALPEAITRFLGFLGGAAGRPGGTLRARRGPRFAASRPPNRRCRVLDYRRKTRCLPNARMAHSRTDDAARCVLGECWRSDRVPAVGREYLCSRPAA